MSRLMEKLYDVCLPVRDALAIQAVLDGDRSRAVELLGAVTDPEPKPEPEPEPKPEPDVALTAARYPAAVVETPKPKPKPKPKGKPKGITFGKGAKGGHAGMKRTCTVCGKEKGVTGFLSRSHICRACADKAGQRAKTMAEAEA